MKKLFLDLGSHVGKAIKKFQATHNGWSKWEIHAFEPNPFLSLAYGDGVVIHKVAAWIENTTKPFYVNPKKPTDDGASLLSYKLTGNLDTDNPVSVVCIDFGEWVLTHCSPGDKVIVKMDIEGAEYAVLRSMIKDGSIKCINKLYIEAHCRKVGVSEEVSERLLNYIRSLGVIVKKDYIESSNVKAGRKRWHDVH